MLTDLFKPLDFPNLGLVRFPSVEVPVDLRGKLGIPAAATNKDCLKQLAWAGYERLEKAGAFKNITRDEVISQFKVEFETFEKTGVHDYLLLIWDINRWCDENGIIRGYGRGSAASSLTLFCLGITRGVNPLRHHLNFPRFLSEARMKPVIKDGVIWVDGKSAPDIDCDYSYLRRDEVVKYVEQRYAGRTSKISTRLELTGKMALKDTVKTYGGYNEEEAKYVSDMIDVKYGKVQSLSEAREESEQLIKWIAADPTNAEMFDIALQLEGSPVAKGQHPSGVFVSYDLLDGNVPVETSKNGDAVTSYDMETVATLGIKADILGLRTLDLVANTATLARIDKDAIDVDDPAIYEYLLTSEHYAGLFQIEEGITKDVVRRVHPKTVDELAVCLSISRPGALAYIDQYLDFVHKGELKSVYPAIDEILKETGNVLVYQEQITAVCRDVFGLSGIDADQVRYAVGKKKKEDMAKWEEVLKAKGAERGIPEKVVKYFWDVCNASADYLFVKSHALCYSYLAAATAYMRAKHPLEYYLVMMQLAKDEPNATAYLNMIIAEMQKTGVKMLPPDLIKSEMDFSIQDGGIRFGLASIKGITDLARSKFADFKKAPFTTKFEMFEMAKSLKIQINTLTVLFYSGCLSWPNTSRARLVLEAQLYWLLTDREKPIIKAVASLPEYAGAGADLITIMKDLPNRKDEKGKSLLQESRLETLRRDYMPAWNMYLTNSKNEELTKYLFERHLLGFSYTTTLHTCFRQKVIGLVTVADVVTQSAATRDKEAKAKLAAEAAGVPPPAPGSKRKWVAKQTFKFVAFIDEVTAATSKASGKPYVKMKAFDDSESIRVMLFGEDRIEGCRSFNERLPKDGDLAIISGSMSADGGIMFADDITIQPNPVAFKKSEAETPV